jgi:hypothetical protein
MKGRKIAKREEVPERPGYVRLTDENGASIEIRTEQDELSKNFTIRKNVRQVVQPLTRNGVKRFEVTSEQTTTFELKDTEVAELDPPAEAEAELTESEYDAYLLIVAPAFQDDNKWRFSEGDYTFWAPILDPEFIRRVNLGEPFRKGDRLHCLVKQIQTEDESGDLRVERRVIRVHRHIPRHTQLALDGDDDKPAGA